MPYRAWYKQYFNALNNGDLAGQDSWVKDSGGSTFSVQADLSMEGAKNLKITPVGVSDTTKYHRVLTGPANSLDWIWRFLVTVKNSKNYLPQDTTDQYAQVMIGNATEYAVGLQFWKDTVGVVDASGTTTYGETWGTGDHSLVIVKTGSVYSLTVDGTTVATGNPVGYATNDTVDRLTILSSTQSGASLGDLVWLDSFDVSYFDTAALLATKPGMRGEIKTQSVSGNTVTFTIDVWSAGIIVAAATSISMPVAVLDKPDAQNYILDAVQAACMQYYESSVAAPALVGLQVDR